MKLILDDEDIAEIPVLPIPELDRNGIIIMPEKRGREKGGENKSVLDKEIIAIDATVSDLPQNQIAKIHNVTQTEVNLHSRAIDRSSIDGRKTDNELKTLINQSKYKIADRATSALMQSLDLFQPQYLEQKDLPNAAIKMAQIVEKVTAGFEQQSGPNVTFNVYRPETKEESSFEVIEVSE